MSLFVISCGRDEGNNPSNQSMQGTLFIPAAGLMGGQPYLQYNNSQYYMGNHQGEGSNQYNQIINQFMNIPSNNNRYHQIPVTFRGSFTQGSIFMGSGQQQAQVVNFTFLSQGNMNNAGGQGVATLSYSPNNCPPTLLVNGQNLQVSVQSSQQVVQFIENLSPNQGQSQSGSNCFLFQVNYNGSVQGNSVMVQTMSLR